MINTNYAILFGTDNKNGKPSPVEQFEGDGSAMRYGKDELDDTQAKLDQYPKSDDSEAKKYQREYGDVEFGSCLSYLA